MSELVGGVVTLDEAIAKAKADGDVQLAEWLRQARGADAAARWCTEKLRNANRTIRKLQNENAKLRELVVDFDKCLDTVMYLAGFKGFVILPDQKLFDSLHPRMNELGVEVPDV